MLKDIIKTWDNYVTSDQDFQLKKNLTAEKSVYDLSNVLPYITKVQITYKIQQQNKIQKTYPLSHIYIYLRLGTRLYLLVPSTPSTPIQNIYFIYFIYFIYIFHIFHIFHKNGHFILFLCTSSTPRFNKCTI